MTQAITKWYGISLMVDPYVNVNEYDKFGDQLAHHLRNLPNLDLKNVDVHIHRLVIDFSPLCFGIGPLEKRLSNLDVSIGLLNTKKGRGSVWFLNKDLPLRMNPDIEVRARAHQISYSLSGKYCVTHGKYSDYVATAIKHSSDPKHRSLSVTATAHPTEYFSTHVMNIKPVTTKIPFALTKETQLSISF